MNEAIIRDFLARRISTPLFRREISAALGAMSSAAADARLEPMDMAFELFPRHLIQLCDSVLSGELDPALLPAIGRCLLHSGHFYWRIPHPDGRVVKEVLSCWCALDPAGGLSRRQVAHFREWIVRGHPASSPVD